MGNFTCTEFFLTDVADLWTVSSMIQSNMSMILVSALMWRDMIKVVWTCWVYKDDSHLVKWCIMSSWWRLMKVFTDDACERCCRNRCCYMWKVLVCTKKMYKFGTNGEWELRGTGYPRSTWKILFVCIWFDMLLNNLQHSFKVIYYESKCKCVGI